MLKESQTDLRIRKIEDLKVYARAFDLAMRIFEFSKRFPFEERYSLTDQIRRSSRSVCANISEAWRKRGYPKVFISKLNDASQEAAETQTWLKFSLSCGYLNQDEVNGLFQGYDEVFAMLKSMEEKVDRFC